jgi:hypothetical protein
MGNDALSVVSCLGLKFLVAATIAARLLPADLAAASLLSVQSAVGAPGDTVRVAVNYTTDTNAPTLQFDLVYATNYLSSGAPVGGNALSDHQLGSAEPTSGVRRVLIFSLSNSPLTNGVLAWVPFTIAANSPDHDEILVLTNVLVVNSNAEAVPADAAAGPLLIAVPPRFDSLLLTNGGATHLQLSGTPGRSYVISATTHLNPPDWVGLTTNSAPGGILEFDDSSAGAFSARFYRASVAQ